MRLRQKTQTLPTKRTEYPAGSFVETEAGFFYIVNSAKRYRITTDRCLASWRPHRVIKTTEAAVKHHRIAAKMKFRNGSLIWNISDGRIYLIENGLRRHVTSPDVMDKIGAVNKEVICVGQSEIQLHELGEVLT